MKILELIEDVITLNDLAHVSTNMEDADFWLSRQNDMDKVGKPTKVYNKNHIGIKVTSDKILPTYLFYAMENLYNQGYFRQMATGGRKIVHIRTADVKKIKFN